MPLRCLSVIRNLLNMSPLDLAVSMHLIRVVSPTYIKYRLVTNATGIAIAQKKLQRVRNHGAGLSSTSSNLRIAVSMAATESIEIHTKVTLEPALVTSL